MGESVLVHVFGDPGMEMMPECCGCMCLNHNNEPGVTPIRYFFWTLLTFDILRF